jgi:hypothetical protein
VDLQGAARSVSTRTRRSGIDRSPHAADARRAAGSIGGVRRVTRGHLGLIVLRMGDVASGTGQRRYADFIAEYGSGA